MDKKGLEKLRQDAVRALTLYCNEKMWHDLGCAMPDFGKSQSAELVDCMDRAIAKTKADPRFKTIAIG